MLSREKRRALAEAGYSVEDLERILELLSEDASTSGRERKERTPATVGGPSIVGQSVSRLLSGETFRELRG